MKKTQVILVDEKNNEIGCAEKIEAHKKGLLHRAFSIFVFNSRGEMLLQQRASGKYHCGGLWSNTTCSHPLPGEAYEQAVHRRLKEEMGFDCELEQLFSFVYKAEFDNGLTEYEHDTVFVGQYDGQVLPNPDEADDFEWFEIGRLKKEIKKKPEKFTPWLIIALPKLGI